LPVFNPETAEALAMFRDTAGMAPTVLGNAPR